MKFDDASACKKDTSAPNSLSYPSFHLSPPLCRDGNGRNRHNLISMNRFSSFGVGVPPSPPLWPVSPSSGTSFALRITGTLGPQDPVSRNPCQGKHERQSAIHRPESQE